MSTVAGGIGPIEPAVRWFVVTATSEPRRVADRFPAAGWESPIPESTRRVPSGADAEPVSLRAARPGEVGHCRADSP